MNQKPKAETSLGQDTPIKKPWFLPLKEKCLPVLNAVASSNEFFYLLLLTLYVATHFEKRILFTSSVGVFAKWAQAIAIFFVLWGAMVYLSSLFLSRMKKRWKTICLLIIGAILLPATRSLGYRISFNAYGAAMDIFFCAMAYGKSFRRMLHCILAVLIIGLTFSAVGVPLGYTIDIPKPGLQDLSHSLGINYPNTWGYLVFLALLILWYLYLQYKPLFTFALFWAASAFNLSYIACRTIGGLSLLFPIFALLVGYLEKRDVRDTPDYKKRDVGVTLNSKKGDSPERKHQKRQILKGLVVVIPLLAFGLQFFLSEQVEWMYQYYHHPVLRNLSWRFIQNGLYIKHWGIPFLGNSYQSGVTIYENVCGESILIGILDSSFGSYLIMRGALWMAYTLLLLCIAHWKALKKRDFAIICIECILLGFAMMERPGLEMWYNFILLYPLARVDNSVLSNYD